MGWIGVTMKWRVRKPGAKFKVKCRWHNWFAWYPVRVPTKGRMSGMTKVWLQTVRRKGAVVYDSTACYSWNWHYALNGEEYPLKKRKWNYPPMPHCKPPKEV